MRVKRGNVRSKRHKKVLKSNKGYRMTKSKLYKVGHEAYMHAGQYSYQHRRQRKGQMRKIWIDRINAAAKTNGTSYNQMIDKMNKAGVTINRKMLSEIAVQKPDVFSQIAKSL